MFFAICPIFGTKIIAVDFDRSFSKGSNTSGLFSCMLVCCESSKIGALFNRDGRSGKSLFYFFCSFTSDTPVSIYFFSLWSVFSLNERKERFSRFYFHSMRTIE